MDFGRYGGISFEKISGLYIWKYWSSYARLLQTGGLVVPQFASEIVDTFA